MNDTPTQPEPRYRRAAGADVERLVEMRIRFLNEMYHHEDDSETEELRAELQDYFVTAIEDGSFVAWLAEIDGDLVGSSGMVLWRIPGRYGGLVSGQIGYILNLYTVPDARGRGICTRLLTELVREGREQGISYFHLHATTDGAGIYRRMGFRDAVLPEIEMSVSPLSSPVR